MSTPKTRKGKTKPDDAVPQRPATELAVPIGPRVVEVLELAYRARRPILLEGPTGIGKSQIVAEFTRASGLALTVLDLSLLEPPDLIGLPTIVNGRTHYAQPSELPTSGRGVLMLEELNRAEIPVMQPALQLLSARRLHAYELPPGWICVAAINPEDADYQVNRLDPALRSRFLQLSVCADRDVWAGWAERMNIHPVIAGVVRDHAGAFDHASPRSWAYASDVLHALLPSELADRELIRIALRGYLPTSWALLVTEALADYPALPAIDLDTLIAPDALAAMVRGLEKGGRIDAIAMLASKIRKLLDGNELAARAESGAVTLAGLESTLAALPGDLRDQCLDSVVESAAAFALLGEDPGALARSYRGSKLAKEIAVWRRDMKLHRVRLVVSSVFRWVQRADQELDHLAPHLTALATDAGPLGGDLARWLRARSPDAS